MKRTATLKCEDVQARVKEALVAMHLEAAGIPISEQGPIYLELGPRGIRARSAQFPGVTSDG